MATKHYLQTIIIAMLGTFGIDRSQYSHFIGICQHHKAGFKNPCLSFSSSFLVDPSLPHLTLVRCSQTIFGYLLLFLGLKVVKFVDDIMSFQVFFPVLCLFRNIFKNVIFRTKAFHDTQFSKNIPNILILNQLELRFRKGYCALYMPCTSLNMCKRFGFKYLIP